MGNEMGNLRRCENCKKKNPDVKIVKNMEILEMKMIIFKIKKSLAGINRRLAITEEIN